MAPVCALNKNVTIAPSNSSVNIQITKKYASVSIYRFLKFQRSALGSHNSAVNSYLLKSTSSANYVLPRRTKSDVSPKTLDLQNKLGGLPVPNVNDTVAKFLISAKPLLDNEEFATTAKKLLELADPNGIGQKLQDILLKRKEEHDNWVG